MAVGFRAASATWTEITTDLATVAIPGAPQAGDRMFLLVTWKSFGRIISAVSGWTSCGDAFADGSVGTGNGTGSMKVQAFYRDWQSGDSDPAIAWDTTANLLARACILVMTKGASETWDTPLWNTAAWPLGSAQTVSASATTAVPDGSAVLAFIGIRDDSATFTRGATTGIDVASGITWNGNYAEQPPTHHTTTTGNDGSGDAGYRLVTTGGTVTLRVTATISANETGSVGWVTQGATAAGNVTVTPGAFSLAFTPAAPTVTASDHKTATPGAFSLAFTPAAPTVTVATTVTPGAFSLAFTPAAPTVSVSDNKLVTPGAFSLAFTPAAPTVTASDHKIVEPGAFSLAMTMAVPTVTVGAGITVEPGAFSLAFTPAVPTVSVSDNKRVEPGAFSLAFTPAAPTVAVTQNIVVTPDGFLLTMTMAAPEVTATGELPAPTPSYDGTYESYYFLAQKLSKRRKRLKRIAALSSW